MIIILIILLNFICYLWNIDIALRIFKEEQYIFALLCSLTAVGNISVVFWLGEQVLTQPVDLTGE